MRSRISVVLVVFLLSITTTGCPSGGDDDGSGGQGSSDGGGVGTQASPVTSPDLDSAVVSVRDLLASTPTAIANDLSMWGDTDITPKQVDDFARSLCQQAFKADPTVNFLTSEVRSKTLLLLSPAMRLLRLAGTGTYCSRPPTDAETAAYRNNMYRFLADLPATPPTVRSIPEAGKNPICQFVGSQAGGDVVEEILAALVGAATRHSVDPGGYLTFAVEVVGTFCEHLLATVRRALDRYFTT